MAGSVEDDATQDAAAWRLAGRDGESQTLTLAQEIARIGLVREDVGGVRVSTETESVSHIEKADLGVERVEVERRPVGAWVDAMPGVREEGDVTVIPVVEERLVVEKRLFVTEEILIRRNRSTETVEVPVTLRRQIARVERLPAADPAVGQQSGAAPEGAALPSQTQQ